MTTRSVVVTGLGATTPIGPDTTTTWQAALNGTSGARTLPEKTLLGHQLPVQFGAPIHTEPTDALPKHEVKKLDRSGAFAMVASREAWAHCGTPEVDGERLGVVMSTGIGGLWTLLDAYDTLKDRGARRIHPMTVPMLMPNGAAGAVAIDLGAKAGAHCSASACASGAESMVHALQMIRSGRADIVMAGGTEASIHPLPMAGFAAMHALSTRSDSPETASRPFCTTRDGFVLGEGAACLVLEDEEHATARGATIYARLLGGAVTSDAHHIAAPDPNGEGALRAITAALADGGVTASDVTHINAHATSTPAGDVAEAIALRKALGPHVDQAVVTATKSMTGHLLGGAGALESLFAVLSLYHGQCPATTNVEELDPAVDIDVALDKPREISAGVALNNSFGFGGHNAALAFGSA